jgi:hypothetical protein
MTDKLPHEIWHLRTAAEAVITREIPQPEIMPRHAFADEIPRSAKIVMSKMDKAGWTVDALYGKHSWPKQAEKIENDNGDVVERVTYGIVESVVVRGRRGKQRMFAIWMTKPWTKDGDAYKFYTSHFIPEFGKVKSPEMNRLIELREGGVNDGSKEDG